MSYKDNQTQKDYSDHNSYDYTTEEKTQQQHYTASKAPKSSKTVNNNSDGGSRKSIFSRMRDALTGGASNTAKNAKTGFSLWKSEGGMSSGFGKVMNVLKKPRILAIIMSACGIGSFSLFGLFSSYKNDGVVKNEQPLSCESGYVDYTPRANVNKNVKQETVDVMYDVFVKTYGYSEEFLTGMLSCMMAECELNYSNIERDWTGGVDANETQRYVLFYNIAGGGDYEVLDTNPTTQEVLDAYHRYSDAMSLSWEPVKNDFYTCDYNGRKGVGIGLIGWTGNNGVDFITSVDKIQQDYDWYDLPYQCAYILATFKKDSDSTMQNGRWRTEMQTIKEDQFSVVGTDSEGKPLFKYDGVTYNNKRSEGSANLDEIPEDQLEMYAATKWYFERYVNGGASDTQQYNQIIDRWKNVAEVKQMITSAKVRSQYSSDVIAMTDLIYMNTVNEEVYRNQNAQICLNDTVLDPVDVAMAAVSLSWLEKGDYMDDNAAYGEYKRASESPSLINDWDFVEMKNDSGPKPTKEEHAVGIYDSGSLKGLTKYDAHECGCGNHDLIACTEFYYYAHLTAFPEETDEGFFSSCDRGTGTAVRISGADDNFPAGNPPIQLEYVLGSNMENLFEVGPEDRSDQHNAQNQKLWKPTGFLRGCDWYSFEGKNTITEGNIGIAWNQVYANGFGDGGGSESIWHVDDPEKEMNLRFVFTNSSTQTHIITYSGGAAVRTFWGFDFLKQQFDLYDDADSLVRNDLTIQAPDIMQKAANFKAIYAKEAFDQNVTFYMSQYEHANDKDAKIADGGSTAKSLITHREDTQFNQKTGLPEFRSWEQIFIRLTHDVDDNGATSNKYATDQDGYLDDCEDHIVQYGEDAKSDTKANSYYYKDWNDVGYNGDDYAQAPSNRQGSAYQTDWVDYDCGSDKDGEKWARASDDLFTNNYWRYEIAADIEYRTLQLERFSMAAFMCSYASENDVNAYQNMANADATGLQNSSGHILGNVYRRMSRVGDNSDKSGRYYYYNTVVSNDMLQDLVQLYNVEGPDKSKITNGLNFGPYYDLSTAIPGAKSNVYTGLIGDRRYGLTDYDVQNILNGYARKDADAAEKLGWGTDEGQVFQFGSDEGEAGSFSNRMYKYMTTPLYDISKEVQNYGNSKPEGNEGEHKTTDKKEVYYGITDDDKIVAQDLYGVNPFLMVQEYNKQNGQETNERIGAPMTTVAEKDKWLSFIDRHYYPDKYGNINMYAYNVLAMNPSLGYMSNGLDDYNNKLDTYETIYVDNGTGRYMRSCVGMLRYTDYIYSDDPTHSEAMGDRLFEQDDRNDDDIRDDYNRREYILVPYYHTHIAYCAHDPRLTNISYSLHCLQTVDNIPVGQGQDCNKIDGIYYLNKGGCTDAIDTFTFDSSVLLRGKYNGENLASISAYSTDIRYFLEDGTEIKPTNNPPIHKTCGGCTFTNVHNGTDAGKHHANPNHSSVGHECILYHEPGKECTHASCPHVDTCPFCGASIACGTSHSHSCEECKANGWPHGDCCHYECDDGGEDLECDDCHNKYGCNECEYYFHTGRKVFMLLKVVDNPVTPIDQVDINNWRINGSGPLKPDKGNLVQLIEYDKYGYVDEESDCKTALEQLSSLGSASGWAAHADLKLPPYHTYDPYGIKRKLDPGYQKDLVGFFTIEGNIIVRDFDKRKNGDQVVSAANYCNLEDLALIESIRNRVGNGKYSTYTANGQAISQNQEFVTDLKGVLYDNGSADPGGKLPETNTGYGEVLITGAAHSKSPMHNDASLSYGQINDADWLCGGYGDPNEGGGSGPDTAQGNVVNQFGDSLIRYLLGDEHVYHIRFGSQNEDVIKGDEYKFQYFEEFVDVDPDAMYIDHETGGLTMSEYSAGAEQFKNDDGTYKSEADVFKNTPIPNKYANTPKTFVNDSSIATELLERYKADDVKGQDKGLNGDYGVWITHASRGDRGMKTEYLVLKDWFGDPYDGEYETSNMQYMFFEHVMQKDTNDVDHDGDTDEAYIYGNSVFGSINNKATYGQGSNSHWRNLINLYNESLATKQ